MIMRFMTAENVVAITPDNAAGPYNCPLSSSSLLLLRFPRKVREMISILRKIVAEEPSVVMRTGVYDSEDGIRIVWRVFKATIIDGTRERASVITMRREETRAYISQRNFISTMTLFD